MNLVLLMYSQVFSISQGETPIAVHPIINQIVSSSLRMLVSLVCWLTQSMFKVVDHSCNMSSVGRICLYAIATQCFHSLSSNLSSTQWLYSTHFS
jgi:hypothetical protein